MRKLSGIIGHNKLSSEAIAVLYELAVESGHALFKTDLCQQCTWRLRIGQPVLDQLLKFGSKLLLVTTGLAAVLIRQKRFKEPALFYSPLCSLASGLPLSVIVHSIAACSWENY